MTPERRKKIASQIQAMMATVGNSKSTDGEKETALEMANRLCMKYGIKPDEIERKDDNTFELKDMTFWKQRIITKTKRGPYWMKQLGHFTDDFVGAVEHYIGNFHKDNKNWSITFYGPKTQVELAIEVYRITAYHIQQQAKTKYKGYVRGNGADFAQGFVSGLRSQLFKAITAVEESNKLLPAEWQKPGLICMNTELTIQCREWSLAKLEQLHGVKLHTVSSSSGSSNPNRGAHAAGVKAGKSYSGHQNAGAKRLS